MCQGINDPKSTIVNSRECSLNCTVTSPCICERSPELTALTNLTGAVMGVEISYGKVNILSPAIVLQRISLGTERLK